MAEYAIAKPQITVNDDPIAVIPNSVKYSEGEGETTVRTTSGGGSSVVVIISDNAEDKKGMVSFDLANTVTDIDNARIWKQNAGLNTVAISGELQNGQQFNRVMNQATIINNPEIELSTEGKLTLTWEGSQMV